MRVPASGKFIFHLFDEIPGKIGGVPFDVCIYDLRLRHEATLLSWPTNSLAACNISGVGIAVLKCFACLTLKLIRPQSRAGYQFASSATLRSLDHGSEGFVVLC